MSRVIFCQKLQQDLEALDRPPFPNALGERIYNHISKPAWQLWIQHQTMLINEYRLTVTDSKARQFLLQEMEKFLFGEGSEKPKGYMPE